MALNIQKRQTRQAQYRERKKAAGFAQKNFWIHQQSIEAGLNGDSFQEHDEFSYKVGQLVALERKKESENSNDDV